MQGSVHVSRMKHYYAGEEQPSTKHTRQSLEDKPTKDMLKNSHEHQTLGYETTDSILTSKDKSDHLEIEDKTKQ